MGGELPIASSPPIEYDCAQQSPVDKPVGISLTCAVDILGIPQPCGSRPRFYTLSHTAIHTLIFLCFRGEGASYPEDHRPEFDHGS